MEDTYAARFAAIRQPPHALDSGFRRNDGTANAPHRTSSRQRTAFFSALLQQSVVKVDRERKREIFRQINASGRRNTGSISRFGNAELCGKDPLSARRDFHHGLLACPWSSGSARRRPTGLKVYRDRRALSSRHVHIEPDRAPPVQRGLQELGGTTVTKTGLEVRERSIFDSRMFLYIQLRPCLSPMTRPRVRRRWRNVVSTSRTPRSSSTG